MFTEQQLKIIEYCAEEVKRQGDTPNHVYHMLNAWNYAYNWKSIGNWDRNKGPQLTLDIIEEIGRMVDPVDNANGFRTIRIGVGNGFEWIEKAKPDRIVPQLEALLYSYYHGLMTPKDDGWGKSGHNLSETAEDEFYYHFENIHPLTDGNGRTGKILYNYLRGTLDNPVWPPNFWNIPNP